MNRIILFDGICNFCNSSVQFIIKRDSNENYQFASLQGEVGKDLLKKHGLKGDLSSVILIEGDRAYIKSNAALRICRNLSGLYPFLSIFLIIPSPIRDIFYDVIAKNRYKWFGKKESCMIPPAEVRGRFLD
ncbi:thiol-disulfide oxidoreductase DCC family protein [Ferdinandcohnia quinoae]|uniref:Thiol-disulfide oxidoreductase DCC family protein n=1 Tax=Fredinandcohnia quinoae TaxID=2918902 RepID=A0AAW5E659_9BACI|nr:thiol-disulfide oxidoreductase DCC family protein [Fredinandcohnia sp. SECRCQ15]MCH1625372.1 thiol-disulfide oxidoreductase DCC family protein [Fredinandcohnia sp. SECRCQ15]